MKEKLLSLVMTLVITLSFCTSVKAENAILPEILGEAAIVIDVSTGEIVYEKNADKSPMYPASVTKLMTSLIFAENSSPTDIISYTESARKQEAFSLWNIIPGLRVGDTMNGDNLMKALMIYSANDSAVMIADKVAGSTEAFADLMNKKATELGLTTSNFVTPNGLHNDQHYTSAYDLSILMRAAYNNEWVKEAMQITSTPIIMSSGTSAEETNRNKLIGETLDESYLSQLGVNLNGASASNAICVGGKTGYTGEAGRCLAAMFEKDGRLLVGVVLKSVYKNADNEDLDVFKDMASIINWSYNAEKVTYKNNDAPYVANSQISSVEVAFKPLIFIGPKKTIEVPLTLKEDVKYYENKINDKEITENIELTEINPWKLKDDASVGKLNIIQRETNASYELYPTLTTSNLIMMSKFTYLLAIVGLVAILLLLRILLVSSSRKKRRKSSRGNKYRY